LKTSTNCKIRLPTINTGRAFLKYPPKYSISFVSKMIKCGSSIVLRKKFPHLKEWCGKHLRASSCYHGSVGAGWEVVEKYIPAHNTYEHNRR